MLKDLVETQKFFAFDNAVDWQNTYLEPFYLYFNTDNKFLKTSSLFAFYGMIKNWFDGSSYAFMTDVNGNYLFHDAEKYFESIIVAAPEIQKKFPVFYSHIGFMLYEIDNKKKLDIIFPEIDKKTIENLKFLLFSNKSNNILNFVDVIKELEI